MNPDTRFEPFNRRSLLYFRELFASLQPPEPAGLSGAYRAFFIGPAWLRLTAGPSIALGGMPGWWGKEFGTGGEGLNLLYRRSQFERVMPFTLNERISVVDGKMGVTVCYHTDCPFPWTHVLDELRTLEQGCLLGMTVVNTGLLRRVAFPFLLIYQEHDDGL